MFFRLPLRMQLAAYIVLPLLFSACSSALNDREKKEEVITLGSSETQCLSNAAATVQRYFDGASSAAEIGGFWDCSTRALDLFSKYTRGKSPGNYDPGELRRFFEKYFLGTQKIQDELLTEGMKLKNAVIGGGVEKLSVDEIKTTIEVIRALKTQSVRLIAYQPLRPSHMKLVDEGFVDRAADELVRSAEEIGKALSASAREYTFDDMQALFKQVDIFLTAAGVEVTELKTMVDVLPVVRVLKGMLVSRSHDAISAEDWAKMLVTGTRWYAWTLKVSQLKGRFHIFMWGDGLRRAKQLAGEMKGLLNASISSWPKSTIPFSEFDALFDAMGDKRINDWVYTGGTATTVKKTLRPIIQRVMGGTETGATGRAAGGLSADAVERAWKEFDRFVEGQNFLESLFDRLAGKGGWTPARSYAPEELLRVSEITAANPLAADAAVDMKYMILWYRPLFLGDDEQVFFYPATNDRRHSFHNLSQMNWMRAASRLFIAGYGEEGDDGLARASALAGLTQNEAKKIYFDFRDFGIEIKVFDKRTDDGSTATKRFTEANLFSFQADGGTLLGLDEMIQMIAFLSSATVLANQMHSELAKICPNDSNLDIYGLPLIEAKCYREKLFDKEEKRIEHFLDHMPVMASFYRDLDDKDRKAFENFLESAVRGDRKNSPLFESDDSKGIATLLHYVEAVFSRYDIDQSRTMGKSESNKAYPVFEGTLAEASGIKDKPKRLKNLFTYLLKHGKKPDPDCFWDKVSFVWWMIQGPFQSFHADRTRILQILAILSEDQSAATPGSDTQKKSCKRKARQRERVKTQ
ncbi:MAG: hypothetical protein HYW49_01995 [Deltaproteobacteria bacterium]|nr:hypothetical protein [Deltaproteobacteria bacterium]